MTVDWSQYDAQHLTALVETPKKKLYAHQTTALEKVRAGFDESERGKLVMASGTGKTFTSLRIAEEHAGPGKAVLFLAPSLKPRRSKIDIVQAIGRVMRKPKGKEMGYIILPIAVTAGQDASTALNENTDYDVVWDVLQALRSHDERFNAYINRIALLSDEPGTDPDGPIDIINANPPVDADETEGDTEDENAGVQSALFTFEEWSGAIYTKIVKKVGTRTCWEDWARTSPTSPLDTPFAFTVFATGTPVLPRSLTGSSLGCEPISTTASPQTTPSPCCRNTSSHARSSRRSLAPTPSL